MVVQNRPVILIIVQQFDLLPASKMVSEGGTGSLLDACFNPKIYLYLPAL